MTDTPNRTSRGRATLGSACALLALAGLALAQNAYDSARKARGANNAAQTWYITDADGTHSRTDPSALDVQQILNDDTWILVDIRGTVPGATAQIMCWTGAASDDLDVAEVVTVTFTTAANPGSDGYQPLTRTAFTCAGDAYYAIGIPNVSAGTVDAKARTVGFGSRAAE